MGGESIQSFTIKYDVVNILVQVFLRTKVLISIAQVPRYRIPGS